MKEKSFATLQIEPRRYGGPGQPKIYLLPPFWLTKNFLLQHHATTKKTTMMQKGKITFNFTYISSKLKFLNTESLVVQISKTRLNI